MMFKHKYLRNCQKYDITKVRAKAILGNLSFEEKERLATETGRVIKDLIVAAENYPDPKASQNFLQLQVALNEVEEQLLAARRALSAHITVIIKL